MCRVKGEEALATAVCVFPPFLLHCGTISCRNASFAKACGVPGMTGNTPTCLLRNVEEKKKKKTFAVFGIQKKKTEG